MQQLHQQRRICYSKENNSLAEGGRNNFQTAKERAESPTTTMRRTEPPHSHSTQQIEGMAALYTNPQQKIQEAAARKRSSPAKEGRYYNRHQHKREAAALQTLHQTYQNKSIEEGGRSYKRIHSHQNK